MKTDHAARDQVAVQSILLKAVDANRGGDIPASEVLRQADKVFAGMRITDTLEKNVILRQLQDGFLTAAGAVDSDVFKSVLASLHLDKSAGVSGAQHGILSAKEGK